MKKLLLVLPLWTLFGLTGCAEEVQKVQNHDFQKIQVPSGPAVFQATAGERALFDYRFAETTYKPYVSKLYTPSGVNILRDAPPDHLHHHGLMLGFTIENGNFWDEQAKRKPGKQVTTKIDAREDRVVSTIDLIRHDGEKVAVENRTIRAVTLEGVDATTLDWCSTFTCAEGRKKVDISGRHFFGLGLRFVESMDQGGRFFFDDRHGKSETVRGDERLTEARWVVYTAKVDGKPVTVAVFASPKNPLPMKAFTMGDASPTFAYLSATLGLDKAPPLELKSGEPRTLRWMVALWDGEATSATVDAAYQAWMASL